jgi:hypothetical protein
LRTTGFRAGVGDLEISTPLYAEIVVLLKLSWLNMR